MIKKTFTKLVCVILCILTVVCSSGCVRSCIDNYVKEREQRDLSQIIEILQEQKAIAETYIPECTEYSLKIMPTEYFKTDEERTALGFMKYRDFFNSRVYPMYEYNCFFTDDWIKIFQIIQKQSETEYCVLYEMIHPENRMGTDFFNELYVVPILFDNKFFCITQVEHYMHGEHTYQAPALYLFDFENEQILYCGCALEFYDFHKNGIINNWKVRMESISFDYKIIKNGDANNEENN